MQSETKVMEKTGSGADEKREVSVPAGSSQQEQIKHAVSARNRVKGKGASPKVVAGDDATAAPAMDKPLLDPLGEVKEPSETKGKAKGVAKIGSRARELSSLIGRTNRLELKRKHIVKSVAFISNKGGVGKTHISSNMAFYLGRLNRKALLIDLDLGNSDVTNKLGFYCDHTVIDLLQGKRFVNQLIYTTPNGFDVIAGESGNFKLANLNNLQKSRFIKAFREVGNDYDFVMFDLSAGISSTTLDFALAQDYQVIVTTPQDIVAGYACIKAAFHRFQELEESMLERDPDYRMRRKFRPMIVFNQVPEFKAGRDLFERMKQVAQQNLNGFNDFEVEPLFLGAVVGDQARIRESELKRELYSGQYGATQTGQCFNFLAHNISKYRDPNSINFTTKLKRFVDIFMKSVGETKYAS